MFQFGEVSGASSKLASSMEVSLIDTRVVGIIPPLSIRAAMFPTTHTASSHPEDPRQILLLRSDYVCPCAPRPDWELNPTSDACSICTDSAVSVISAS